MTLPTVVIVGRPNVGKSTLFNRIVGEQVAIVEDRPGVTRDRKEIEAEWLGVPFLLVDTGGWLPGGNELDAKVSRQVEAAVKTADVVLFVVDATVGVTDDDEAIANWLRRIKAPVLLVANKADNERRENERWEFLALGLGEPVSGQRAARPARRRPARRGRLVAAGHRTSTRACAGHRPRGRYGAVEGRRSAARHASRSSGGPTSARARCSTAWSARTGRSSTTWPARPATPSTPWSTPRTARSCSSTPPACAAAAGSTTRPSTTRSCVRCVPSTAADIALLVIDATEGVTSQDQRLAERVDAAGCPIVVMLNKWELIDDPEQRLQVQAELKRKLYFVGDAPVLKISALTGKGVNKLRPVLQEAIEQYHRRVPTRDVNRVISDAQQRQPAGHGVQGAVRRCRARPTRRRSRCSSTASCRRLPALPRAQHPRGVRVR